MAAFGRLWRRAPGWRVCLVTAIASTTLAAMFPPAIPVWTRTLVGRATGVGIATPQGASPGAVFSGAPLARPGATAHFAPQPDPPAVDGGPVMMPAPGPGRAGIIPFAGRQIPLPAGLWQDLVVARDGAAIPVQVQLFGRIDGGHLTGLLLATAPNPINGAAGPMLGAGACFAPDTIVSEIIPQLPGTDFTTRECWTLATTFMTSTAARKDQDFILQRGLARVDQLGAIIPEAMLALRTLRADQTGWLTTLLLLPDRRASSAGNLRRVEAWVRRYVVALHRGFSGELSGKDVSPAVVRDPE